jgi:peptidoglycan-associated lipoprotein
MRHLSSKVAIILSIAVIGLTGCTKKPIRPDPGATMMGPGAGGSGGYSSSSVLNPNDLGNFNPDQVADGDSSLVTRGANYIENDQMIRGLLEPVYFDFDQSGIKASERIKLESAMIYLSENPQYRLMLEGHCDWRGTAEYNLGLGDRRANSARQFLETAGVASNRLEIASKGNLDAAENGSATAMAQDRRVELVILKQ